MHTLTNQKKRPTTQNQHKKLKPGLVTSYDIQPGNREGLFLFRQFINLSLTYLLTQTLTHLSWNQHGAIQHTDVTLKYWLKC